MSLNVIHVAPETFVHVQQNGQPVVVYECKLQEGPCALFVEGTTTAISTHLRLVHGITGPDNADTNCTWGTCSRCQSPLLHVRSNDVPSLSRSCAYQILRGMSFGVYGSGSRTRRTCTLRSCCPASLIFMVGHDPAISYVACIHCKS
ncbi:hypothetical protein M405DRAFT_807910 [Rhizopogon salebrosus TDB-379]|nr:hypothetical protein M405DRAFT_807910 [Rhizopogon salebrosus TDB-379]